ncbi:MAG: hypothetical protein ACLQAT_26210 [Candidatus Binataceae bacterium]
MKTAPLLFVALTVTAILCGCSADKPGSDPMRAAMIAADLSNRHPADRERVPDDGTPYRLTDEQKKAAASAYRAAMAGEDPESAL